MGLIVPIVRHKWATIKAKWIVALEHQLIIKNDSQFPARRINLYFFQVRYII